MFERPVPGPRLRYCTHSWLLRLAVLSLKRSAVILEKAAIRETLSYDYNIDGMGLDESS